VDERLERTQALLGRHRRIGRRARGDYGDRQ
jgi:hypothetical protein